LFLCANILDMLLSILPQYTTRCHWTAEETCWLL